MRHNQFLKNRHPATYCGEGAPLSRAWNALDQIKRALGLGPATTYQQTAEAVLKVVADLAQTRRSLDNKEHEARALERLHCIAVEQRDALQAIVDDIQAVLRNWSQERIPIQKLAKGARKLLGLLRDSSRENVRLAWVNAMANVALDEARIPREIRRPGQELSQVLTLYERIRMLMEARDEALKMPLHGAAPLPPDPIEVLRPCGWSGHVQ